MHTAPGPWTNHEGKSGCPTHQRDRIELKQRGGLTFETDFPNSWTGWVHDGSSHDIVSYRVLSKHYDN